ncbi:MAG: hypothetical protein ACXVA9_09930 [Bdellovibrionales bacterium]
MKKNLWRLTMALVISSGCFIATILCFDTGKSGSDHGDKPAMASLQSSTNEVQRKPLQRVIWETVNKNDDLFPGEAVRTAPNAEAQLYFKKSKTTIHLDPDSLVVLEETDKGLSLDFLQGNMFVQSAQGGEQQGEGLTVKTGNGEIKVKSADMSLSKNKNGNVDLEVHRGEAELNQGSKKTALNKEKSAELSENGVSVSTERMQVLNPQAGETLYLNLAKGEKLDLTWKPLPAGYSIGVEVGKSRNVLEKVAGVQTGGETGALSVTSKPGSWYLRLVATSEDPKKPRIASAVIPFIVQPKSAPLLDEPRNEAAILKTEPEAPTTFKWVARHKYLSQVLEIATDPAFKKIAHREEFSGDKSDLNTFAAKLDDGSYFWRVTGFLKLKNKTESLSSKANKFALISKWEIKAPTLISPVNSQHLSFLDSQKSGVALKWQIPQGVEQIKVEIQQKTGAAWKTMHEHETETASLRMNDLKPGTYQWRAISLDSKGGEPKPSAYAQFTIEEMPKIEWVETQPTVEYEYTTPTPSVRGHWKPLAAEPATYRFKVAPEEQGIENGNWQNTKQALFDIPVPAEGKYLAQIEALNAKGALLGQSDVKAFVVKHRPLLPAPQWASTTPEVLKGDGKGNLTFGWEQVEGAQRYLMILESPDGQVVDKREVSRNTASLNRLKPGEYQVHLQAIDGLKRPGTSGEKRKVQVPSLSDIRAPKIKAMKVK